MSLSVSFPEPRVCLLASAVLSAEQSKDIFSFTLQKRKKWFSYSGGCHLRRIKKNAVWPKDREDQDK